MQTTLILRGHTASPIPSIRNIEWFRVDLNPYLALNDNQLHSIQGVFGADITNC